MIYLVQSMLPGVSQRRDGPWVLPPDPRQLWGEHPRQKDDDAHDDDCSSHRNNSGPATHSGSRPWLVRAAAPLPVTVWSL